MTFYYLFVIIKIGDIYMESFDDIYKVIGDLLSELRIRCDNNYQKITEAKKITDKISLYDAIIYNFTPTDREELLNGVHYNVSALELVFSKEKAAIITDRFINNYYQYKNVQDTDEDLFIKDVNKLKNALIRLKGIYLKKVEKTNAEVEKEKKIMMTYRYLLKCFNKKEYISDYTRGIVNQYLEELGKPDTYKVLVNEGINKHNAKTKGKKKISYIEQAIKDKIEIYDIDLETEEKYYNVYGGVAESYASTVINMSRNDLNTLRATFEELDAGYSLEQLDYFYKKILNRIASELSKYKAQMLDFSIYQNLDERNMIIMEYNSLFTKYNFVKDYYEELMTIIELDEENKEEIKTDEEKLEVTSNEINPVYNPIFISYQDKEPLFMKDLDDIVPEYYETIKKLLISKVNGTISPGKEEKITGNNKKIKGLFKLKHDQVRILCKPLPDNNFMILGVLEIKKTEKAREYAAIVKRFSRANFDENITPELKEENISTLKDIIEYLDKTKRNKFR